MHRTIPIPLADQLRPQRLEDVVGQDHLLGPLMPLAQMVGAGRVPSLILWGPPGTGKTTLARLLGALTSSHFETVSALASGVVELRKIFLEARERQSQGKKTLLFVDEIHRFNRTQQDSFLGVVEEGTLTLFGATTENPSFALNSALLSRCQTYTLKRLEEPALQDLLCRAEGYLEKTLPLTQEARSLLCSLADGDGRSLLNKVESILQFKDPLDEKTLLTFLERRSPLYDKSQEGHYNLISALHKSLRGSDVDASLYWLCRMIDGGEDPRFIARRLVRFASEDVGLADPQALSQALEAEQAYHFLGSPEGELALAQAVIYLATAPKSNAIYKAYKEAMMKAKSSGSLMPPKAILNAPTSLMKKEGYGEGYIYDPDTKESFSGQNYFPEALGRPVFYKPYERGYEREIIKRLEYWKSLRARLGRS